MKKLLILIILISFISCSNNQDDRLDEIGGFIDDVVPFVYLGYILGFVNGNQFSKEENSDVSIIFYKVDESEIRSLAKRRGITNKDTLKCIDDFFEIRGR